MATQFLQTPRTARYKNMLTPSIVGTELLENVADKRTKPSRGRSRNDAVEHSPSSCIITCRQRLIFLVQPDVGAKEGRDEGVAAVRKFWQQAAHPFVSIKRYHTVVRTDGIPAMAVTPACRTALCVCSVPSVDYVWLNE